MGIKTVTVATCDGKQGTCQGSVVAVVNGRTLCESCVDDQIESLINGNGNGALTIERFDPDAKSPQEAAPPQGEAVGMCYECVPPRGPFKALSAHRRKYHQIFVRGPKAKHEAPAGMGKIPFDAGVEAEAAAERKLTPLDDQQGPQAELEEF